MKLVCIACPISCSVEINESDGVFTVTGNSCQRGRQHAINEYTCPKRMLTTTVRVINGSLRRLPVISTGELAKKDLNRYLEQIYCISVDAPVNSGQIIVENIDGNGIDIVAARAMGSAQ